MESQVSDINLINFYRLYYILNRTESSLYENVQDCKAFRIIIGSVVQLKRGIRTSLTLLLEILGASLVIVFVLWFFCFCLKSSKLGTRKWLELLHHSYCLGNQCSWKYYIQNCLTGPKCAIARLVSLAK